MNLSFLTSRFSKLSKRERIIAYVTLAVVFAALAARFVLSPVLAKMEQLDQDIAAREREIKKSLVILSSEKQIITERDHYLSMAKDEGSEEEQMTGFLKEIETLAKESSVYLLDIKPSGQNKKGETRQYFLELNFEAQMEQVFAFFYGINHSGKLIRIMRYQIRPKAEGASVVSCNLAVMKMIVPQ